MPPVKPVHGFPGSDSPCVAKDLTGGPAADSSYGQALSFHRSAGGQAGPPWMLALTGLGEHQGALGPGDTQEAGQGRMGR